MAEQIMDLGWWLLPAVLVAVLGAGRWARLVTHDVFPPAAALREAWERLVKGSPKWTVLFHCFWCFTPWLMLACIGWFLLSINVPWIAWAWWLFWGWGALSYVASMIVARDEPAE